MHMDYMLLIGVQYMFAMGVEQSLELFFDERQGWVYSVEKLVSKMAFGWCFLLRQSLCSGPAGLFVL